MPGELIVYLMVKRGTACRYPASLITFFFSIDMKCLLSRTNKNKNLACQPYKNEIINIGWKICVIR